MSVGGSECGPYSCGCLQPLEQQDTELAAPLFNACMPVRTHEKDCCGVARLLLKAKVRAPSALVIDGTLCSSH